LALFELTNFSHHVLEQVANEQLGILVALHALVNLNPDHFANLVRYLQLLAPKAINLVSDAIADFRELRTQVYFLLCSRELLLPKPSVDATDLSVKVS
jgi:hypothetical protein